MAICGSNGRPITANASAHLPHLAVDLAYFFRGQKPYGQKLNHFPAIRLNNLLKFSLTDPLKFPRCKAFCIPFLLRLNVKANGALGSTQPGNCPKRRSLNHTAESFP